MSTEITSSSPADFAALLAGEPVVDDSGEAAESTSGRPGRAPRRRDKKDSGCAARRSFAIHGYIGPNGAGKSLALILDTIATIRGIQWTCTNEDHLHTAEGITTGYRKILSTVPILNPETGEPSEYYVPLREWSQLLEAEHCDVIFDEVVGIASARESQGLPVQVANVLVQLRRRDILLRWSAPGWSRADKIIRECTQAVTEARGFKFPVFGKDAPSRGAAGRAWRPNTLFKWRTFPMADYDDWTSGKRDKLKGSKKVTWYWGPGSIAFAAYDTLGAVSRVGEVLDSGRCAHCGGRRSVPVCKCDAPRKGAAVSFDHDHQH